MSEQDTNKFISKKVLINEDIYKHLEELAEVNGITVSKYIENVIDKSVKDDSDLQSALKQLKTGVQLVNYNTVKDNALDKKA